MTDESLKPQEVSEKMKVPQYLERFKAYHRENLAWGSLHIVLDDNNVDDESVRHCINFAYDQGDKEGEELARILLSMSKTQRSKIGRIA